MTSSGLAAILALASGCTSIGGHLPGGGDSTNKSFFKDEQALMSRVNTLTSALKNKQTLTMKNVLDVLGRDRLELGTMNRSAIRGALEGTGSSPVPLSNTTLTEKELACKEGLSFSYRSTSSAYAFNNPIKWQRAVKGFAYNVNMIFNNCNSGESTLETVIIDGGPVDEVHKKTVFDLFDTKNFLPPSIR